MSFDAYADWLQIPPHRRPPTFYDLLGVPEGERDRAQLQSAYANRYEQVRKYTLGAGAEDAQRLLNELSQAVTCLTDPTRREKYNKLLGLAPELELADDSSSDVSSKPSAGASAEIFAVYPEPDPVSSLANDGDDSQASMAKLLEEEFGQGPVQPTSAPANASCPACGSLVAKNAVICLECGFDFRTGQSHATRVVASPSEPESPPNDGGVWNTDAYFDRLVARSKVTHDSRPVTPEIAQSSQRIIIGVFIIASILCMTAVIGWAATAIPRMQSHRRIDGIIHRIAEAMRPRNPNGAPAIGAENSIVIGARELVHEMPYVPSYIHKLDKENSTWFEVDRRYMRQMILALPPDADITPLLEVPANSFVHDAIETVRLRQQQADGSSSATDPSLEPSDASLYDAPPQDSSGENLPQPGNPFSGEL